MQFTRNGTLGKRERSVMLVEILCVLFIAGGLALLLWGGLELLKLVVGLLVVVGGMVGLILSLRRRNRSAVAEAVEPEVVEPHSAPSHLRAVPRRDVMGGVTRGVRELVILGVGIAGAIFFGYTGLTGVAGSIVLAVMGVGGWLLASSTRHWSRTPFFIAASVTAVTTLLVIGAWAVQSFQSPEQFRSPAWEAIMKEGSFGVKTAQLKDAVLKPLERIGVTEAARAAGQFSGKLLDAGLRRALRAFEESGLPQEMGVKLPEVGGPEAGGQKPVAEKPPEKKYFPVDLYPKQKDSIEAAVTKLGLGPYQAELYRGEATYKRAEQLKADAARATLEWFPYPLVLAAIFACCFFVGGGRESAEETDAFAPERRREDVF